MRYSVNGGKWQSRQWDAGDKDDRRSIRCCVWKSWARKHSVAEARLEPGDLVSYYAVAKDRGTAVQTDLFMVQVQPFERRFTQGQGGGGRRR